MLKVLCVVQCELYKCSCPTVFGFTVSSMSRFSLTSHAPPSVARCQYTTIQLTTRRQNRLTTHTIYSCIRRSLPLRLPPQREKNVDKSRGTASQHKSTSLLSIHIRPSTNCSMTTNAPCHGVVCRQRLAGTRFSSNVQRLIFNLFYHK